MHNFSMSGLVNNMGTNCAPLAADLFEYCFKRDFMDSLNKQGMLTRLIGTSMTF